VRRSVLGCVLVALLLPCAGACAGELDEARDLLARGRAAEAFQRLEPLEAARAGEVEFDYLLGVAALDAGRFDRAVIAFERVLAASPTFKSARLDLARAYFALGADDLAAQEFNRLLQAGPNAEGERAIRGYLAAIERRRAGPARAVKGYVEASLGYDNNLSSTTPDFTNAINGAFGIPGVTPTGNSVLRKSGFAALAAGANASVPIPLGLEAVASVDLRARDYRRYGDFDYLLGDVLVGVAQRGEAASLQVSGVMQAFRQDGATPAPADGVRPTSDRDAAGVNIEARRALTAGLELFAVGQWMRLRYPDNITQDTDQAYGNFGVARSAQGPFPYVALLSVFYSKDRARRPLNAAAPEIDVGRHSAGVRGYFQHDFANGALAYLLASWTRRTDDSAFARATTVATGRDTLSEITLGAAWPRGRWSLRPWVTHVRNSSNIALYDFSKTEGGIALRYDFP
jgi:tetratricopeptide (TPR) repeat protein